MIDLRNLNIVVVGLGTSGIDACLLLHKAGACISATDSRPAEALPERVGKLRDLFIDIEAGGHTDEFLYGADIIVVSPGVSGDSIPLVFASKNNIPVIGEMEIGYQLCRGQVVAITGTNGKSTCVTLLGEILTRAGKKNIVCGNIGNSLCGEVDKIDKDTIVVLEVSSFQLEHIVDFKPKISCVLNITEDHLERYKGFDDYVKAKLKIYSRQDRNDVAVLNYDDPNLSMPEPRPAAKILFYSRVTAPENGIFFRENCFYLQKNGKPEKLFDMPDTRLKGFHNIENIMAVAACALNLGVDPGVISEAVKEYSPLGHRMEDSGTVNGVCFIDDSKATNVDSTKRALEGLEGGIILIAGGRDKGGDYLAVKDEVVSKVKKIVLIGEAAEKIRKAFEGIVPLEKADSLEQAAEAAFLSSSPGDKVLLSPMCSSFDMFRDYKHRGDVFKGAVIRLKEKHGKRDSGV